MGKTESVLSSVHRSSSGRAPELGAGQLAPLSASQERRRVGAERGRVPSRPERYTARLDTGYRPAAAPCWETPEPVAIYHTAIITSRRRRPTGEPTN